MINKQKVLNEIINSMYKVIEVDLDLHTQLGGEIHDILVDKYEVRQRESDDLYVDNGGVFYDSLKDIMRETIGADIYEFLNENNLLEGMDLMDMDKLDILKDLYDNIKEMGEK